MRGTTSGLRSDETPESQRTTIPSPQPFPCVAPRVKSPGAYRIVNEEPVRETRETRETREETDESPPTRRSGRILKGP